jgi:hypothetical protein
MRQQIQILQRKLMRSLEEKDSNMITVDGENFLLEGHHGEIDQDGLKVELDELVEIEDVDAMFI